MRCITRGIVRWGLISALALGGATVVLGKDRVGSALGHLKTQAQTMVDEKLVDADDPAALRAQLKRLAEQYPDRIAEVRGEIAEVEHQIAALQHDTQVARKVVTMTGEDLGVLKERVAQAEAAAATTARRVAIRFEGSTFDINEAYAEGTRINKVRTAYADRLTQNEFQLELLSEQKTGLSDILETFEAEYDKYRTQLWQIDQQIEAMVRNERLIELTKEQQATLQSFEQIGEVQNLNQIEAKLAEMRTKQEATLEQLRRGMFHESYEDRARMNLEAPAGTVDTQNPFEIEIDVPSVDEEIARSIAFDDRIVIDG
ncbi:MAG: hypothetical protein AB8G96_08645 [Phycisphaerales bacterium]